MGFRFCNSKSSVSTCYQTNNRNKTTTTNPIRRFSYEDLESATVGFSSDYLLGRGSHGSVYKAVVDSGKLVVAVKRATITKEENFDHSKTHPAENEIEILSRIRNPGLVNLLGYSLGPNERKLVVVEFMANGTLYHHVHCSSDPPPWIYRVRFALQIAEAVWALHSSEPPVIHRDIKSSNILIDENWNARLGDFGLALRGHVEDVRIRSTPPAGTFGYLDPLYIEPEDLSTKSDVFSFGILLLEILSGRNAIDVNYSPASVVDWAMPLIKGGEFDAIYDRRIRPPNDPLVRQQLAVVAGRCVEPRVQKRPSMKVVVSCLRNLNKRFGGSPPIWTNVTGWMWKASFSFNEESDSVEESSKMVSRNLQRHRKVSNVQSVLG